MRSFTRFFVLLHVVVFVGFGLCFTVAPKFFTALLDIAVPTPTALADLRAIYGGLSISVGAYFALALVRAREMPGALFLIIGSSSCLLLGRVYSILADGVPRLVIFGFMAGELGSAAVGWWLYRRLPREGAEATGT